MDSSNYNEFLVKLITIEKNDEEGNLMKENIKEQPCLGCSLIL